MYRVRKPRVKKPEIQPFNEDDLLRIIETTRGSSLGAYYLLSLARGIRPGELAGLRWSDIDLKSQSLDIEQKFNSMIGEIETELKTEAGRRTIPLTDVMVESLRALQSRGGAVFTGPEGGQFRPNNFRNRIWKKLLKDLGIPYRSPYQMRHTFATHALYYGMPDIEIASIMGHADTTVTRKKYERHLKNRNTKQATRIRKLLGIDATVAPLLRLHRA